MAINTLWGGFDVASGGLLPLGDGVFLDTLMGSGSTIAAAEAVGYQSLGIEIDAQYFVLAKKAIPQLATLDKSEFRVYRRFERQVIPLVAPD